MSIAGKAPVARRSLLTWLLGAGGLAIAAIAGVEVPRLLRPHYPPTPYDDLLELLPDRDNAAIVGKAMIATDGRFVADQAAVSLRKTLAARAFAQETEDEIERAQLAEVHGWLMPAALVALCALAASTKP